MSCSLKPRLQSENDISQECNRSTQILLSEASWITLLRWTDNTILFCIYLHPGMIVYVSNHKLSAPPLTLQHASVNWTHSTLFWDWHRNISNSLGNIPKMFLVGSLPCVRCRISTMTLLHMPWSFQVLKAFSAKCDQLFLKSHIDFDLKVQVLGDVSSLSMTHRLKYLSLSASTAAKNILKNWKSENSPALKDTISGLVFWSTPDKILQSVRK